MDAPRRPPSRLPPVPHALRGTGRIGVFERDLRTGAGRWDAGMFALHGLDPAQGTPSLDEALSYAHEDDVERLRQFHAHVRATGQPRADIRFRLRRRDGVVRHVRSYVDVHFDDDGTPVLVRGVLIDETETAAEAQAARERSAELERAVDLADITVWRIDLATMRLHFSTSGGAVRGAAPPPDGVPLDEVRATIHPDDRAAVAAAFEQAVHGDAPVDVIARYRRSDGSWRTLLTRRVAARDAAGRATQLHGVSIDLTELVAERENAARLAERLALITDAAGIGLFSRDVDTGEMWWNVPNLELHGLLHDDAPPSWTEFVERFVHPDDRQRVLAEAAQADRSGRPVRHHDYRVRTADGRERWIYSWAGREERDGRRYAFGVNVDVTDRHVAEAERRERERLEQAGRAQAALLARVSHELRTPMNAVLGFADLLSADAGGALSPAQAEHVARIRQAGRHLLSLIDDLLELAAVDAADRVPQWEAVSLASVAAQALPWVATLAAQHGVRVEAPARLGGTVRADARWLLQVASNLLTNAVKYNRRGGWVRLESRKRTRDGQRQCAVVVRDSGRGLSAEQRARLFQPFERLGVEREGIAGNGIGLAIARRLVERMGGSIEVDSTPGEGSEFCVWLPAAPAAPKASTSMPPPAVDTAPGALAPLSVLCIEDNEVNRALLEGLFGLRPQLRLRTAVDGADGLAQAFADPPDVVLLDMQLPDLHGHEVLRRLRADPRTVDCTVIGLSANVLPDDIRAALDAGCDDYWTKPIDVTRFLTGIDALIQRRAGGADTTL
ncbi:PAS domain-containing protein [Azohydromonas sediminis]|uniref:PAS domain-containing hybrid sensor histidine kinase/response regulator n=1 Tax=Azohydromonas sediminis TaxID=2259674 RepID=UPI000E65AE9D|nr:PAS domain-containing protein [Azohydromonas sediminis]